MLCIQLNLYLILSYVLQIAQQPKKHFKKITLTLKVGFVIALITRRNLFIKLFNIFQYLLSYACNQIYICIISCKHSTITLTFISHAYQPIQTKNHDKILLYIEYIKINKIFNACLLAVKMLNFLNP